MSLPRRRSALASIAALPLLALGCASPGPPRPPSLRLPEPPTDLHAQRVGDHVLISFTTPTNTTDGGALRGSLTATLCRNSGARPTTPPPCTPVQHAPIAAGPIHWSDTLPPALLTGPPALLAYRIRIENSDGHSAGSASPAFAVAGAAPPATPPLRLTPQRAGVLITWPPQPTRATMQLQRTSPAAPPRPIAAPVQSTHRSRSPLPTSLAPGAPANNEVILIPPSTATSDPGGLLDRSARDGQTYTYIAQRVQSVQLGGQSLELRGEPSPPATLTIHNVFPPTAPTGLAAVPSAGFGVPPAIDLSWEPNPEQDILGYNLYRADSADPTHFRQLNPKLLPGPALRDLEVAPGRSYIYRVTAIDHRHNESVPSATLIQTAAR